MEMNATQLAARINAPLCQADISSADILYRPLTLDEIRDFDKAKGNTDTLPVFFDDKSNISFEKIMSSIRRNNKKYGIRAFFIDYLQILNSTQDMSDTERFMGQVARNLKNLAKELDVCIVALSQLSRDKQDPYPRMSRIRASGQIGEAADNVIFIYRPEEYHLTFRHKADLDPDGHAEIIVGKGRNIGTGSFFCSFDKRKTCFMDGTNNASNYTLYSRQDNDDDDNVPF